MQMDYVKQQLPRIDQHARNAAQLCNDSDSVPDALRNCLGELEREAGQAAAMAQAEQDQRRLMDCVDQLEELGDRAMDACRGADGIDDQVRRAVQTVHGAISDLKHSIH